MINRIVLMKLNDKADTSVISDMQAYVSRIGSELDETRKYEFAPNRAAGEEGYNWVLYSAFENEEDMNAYRVAPLHQEFVEFCDPYTEDFVVAYYQAPAA